MICDGSDIKYLLSKRGYTLRDVANDLGISVPSVSMVINGIMRSKRITGYIETLLGLAPGELEISREKRDALVGAA